MEEMSIKILNSSNEEVTLDILYSFVDRKSNKSYIIYTDYTLDKDSNFNLFASEIINENGKYTLLDIIDKKVKDELKNILKDLSKQLSLEEYL